VGEGTETGEETNTPNELEVSSQDPMRTVVYGVRGTREAAGQDWVEAGADAALGRAALNLQARPTRAGLHDEMSVMREKVVDGVACDKNPTPCCGEGK
jgi:hypothetical protein